MRSAFATSSKSPHLTPHHPSERLTIRLHLPDVTLLTIAVADTGPLRRE